MYQYIVMYILVYYESNKIIPIAQVLIINIFYYFLCFIYYIIYLYFDCW